MQSVQVAANSHGVQGNYQGVVRPVTARNRLGNGGPDDESYL